MVNGKKVNIRSYVVQQDDVVSIKPASRKGPMLALIQTAQTTCRNEIPDYLVVEEEGFAGKLVSMPQKDAVSSFPCVIDIDHVCEFLSHHH